MMLDSYLATDQYNVGCVANIVSFLTLLFHLYLLLLIPAASSSAKDCVQLLKLIGVPVIQASPLSPGLQGLCLF